MKLFNDSDKTDSLQLQGPIVGMGKEAESCSPNLGLVIKDIVGFKEPQTH